MLPFNAAVELVMLDTSILLGAESHFFAVEQRSDNFGPVKDPAGFDFVEPAERNTIGVQAGGCVAMRFLADNPGTNLKNNLFQPSGEKFLYEFV